MNAINRNITNIKLYLKILLLIMLPPDEIIYIVSRLLSRGVGKDYGLPQATILTYFHRFIH